MRRRNLWILTALLTSMILPGSILGQGGKHDLRVYILHSYENDHVCGVPQGQGIEKALRNKFGDRVEIKAHYMNTKTSNSTPDRMKAEAKRVLKDIRQFNPDIAFTIDDNAFREVGLKLVAENYPVVFSGMNGQPQNYNKKVRFLDKDGNPDANITGVYEKLHFQTAINAMKGVMPELENVVALLDESPTGKAIRVQIEKELASGDIAAKVLFKHVGTMKAYRDALDKINNDPSIQAVYPVVLSLEDDSGKRVGFKVTIKEFLERSEKPGMALNFAFARLGLFGGASVDFAAMGHQAGEIGAGLLEGQNIRNYPIESAQEYLITFNKSRSDMIGVTIPDELIGAAIVYDKMALLAKKQ